MYEVMKPLVEVIPPLISHFVSPLLSGGQTSDKFAISRPIDVSQTDRPSDFGPLAIKLIELHGQCLPLKGLSQHVVDNFRMKYAVEIYEEFIQSLS